MIRTILVPASGSEKDSVAFKTALAAARLYSAHLNFYHTHIGAGEALAYSEHARFARGKGLRNALDQLGATHERRAMLARRHVTDFCSQFDIAMTNVPLGTDEVTASWHEESRNGEERLIAEARCDDLVVMGRFTHPNGLPPDLLEIMLIECGRPIIIAADEAPRTLTGMVMVCWKDAREAARAVSAAMPLLTKADRVVIVTVDEGGGSATGSATAVARQLAWHRIRADVEVLAANGRPAAESLLSAARTRGADLLVMGGYGKGRMRETVFGGCTKSMLKHAHLPVLMVH